MTATAEALNVWDQFLQYAKKNCSQAAYANWLAPISLIEVRPNEVELRVPNIFVKEYLLDNFRADLCAFLPVQASGNPSIKFVIEAPIKQEAKKVSEGGVDTPSSASPASSQSEFRGSTVPLNPAYIFSNFIEGPANQFVKSAAMGVAARPGKSYNPLFVHGGVGLGKTHLLHSIGHYVRSNFKDLRVQCITTEAFINDLVDNLRNKSVDQMKRYYRSLDVLLVDDIQFLQNRLNFEEEFCNTFEALINQGKQVVIASDKPPGQLKLSERMVARMEWGLVANVGVPDLETRVAILQYKAERKGLAIPSNVAFFIAEHVHANVRQLEGAINRLSAHSRLMNLEITEELVEQCLSEVLQAAPTERITVEHILKSVASVFQVRVTDLKGTARTKGIALARQVAMYLATSLMDESLVAIGNAFGGRAHSTILHAKAKIEELIGQQEMLRRQVDMARRNVAP